MAEPRLGGVVGKRWRKIGALPEGLPARFVETCEALRQLEVEEREWLAGEQQLSPRSRKRREARARRQQVRMLGATAADLGSQVRLRLKAMTADLHTGATPDGIQDLVSVVVAREVSPAALAHLQHPGRLGSSCELVHEVCAASLKQAWQMCGGLSLGKICEHPQPLGPAHHDAVLRHLAFLEEKAEPAWIAFEVPVLDVVDWCLQEIAWWAKRDAQAEKESRATLRWKAQMRLRESTDRARKNLASKGFDAASDGSSLCAAHLEKRVAWNEYRVAEQLARTYQRRKAWEDSGVPSPIASTSGGKSLARHATPSATDPRADRPPVAQKGVCRPRSQQVAQPYPSGTQSTPCPARVAPAVQPRLPVAQAEACPLGVQQVALAPKTPGSVTPDPRQASKCEDESHARAAVVSKAVARDLPPNRGEATSNAVTADPAPCRHTR